MDKSCLLLGTAVVYFTGRVADLCEMNLISGVHFTDVIKVLQNHLRILHSKTSLQRIVGDHHHICTLIEVPSVFRG